MRLINIASRGQLSLTKALIKKIPRYAILSQTWAMDEEEEVSFNDLKNSSDHNKAGYAKIRFCAEQATKDSLQYFWVDTCLYRQGQPCRARRSYRLDVSLVP
jgi:hypothetical protein